MMEWDDQSIKLNHDLKHNSISVNDTFGMFLETLIMSVNG